MISLVGFMWDEMEEEANDHTFGFLLAGSLLFFFLFVPMSRLVSSISWKKRLLSFSSASSGQDEMVNAHMIPCSYRSRVTSLPTRAQSLIGCLFFLLVGSSRDVEFLDG